MEALLKMQSSPDKSSACFKEQLDIIAACIDQKTDAVPPVKEFETRVTSLVKRVNSNAAQNPQDGQQHHRLTAESLLDLVKVTTQLSQLEHVAAQTRSCEAVSSDAKKWQELTSVALDWSRKSLFEQQRGAIEKVAQQLKRSPDESPGSLATPAVAQAPTTLCPPKSVAEACPPKPVAAGVAPDKATPTGFEQGETLRTHLESLAGEDPNRILIVRRINRLGFESPQHLENYFAGFGTVSRMFFANSRVKASAKRPVPRVRPAGLGFVLMEKEEDAQFIANSGPEMMINNVSIEVKLYEPGLAPIAGVEGEEDKA